jgi:hypothetical protein
METEGDGSDLLLRMEIQLRGPLRLALPLVRGRMQRELERDIATIKARLEGSERLHIRSFNELLLSHQRANVATTP